MHKKQKFNLDPNYPKWLYHNQTGAKELIQSADQEAELGVEWTSTFVPYNSAAFTAEPAPAAKNTCAECAKLKDKIHPLEADIQRLLEDKATLQAYIRSITKKPVKAAVASSTSVASTVDE